MFPLKHCFLVALVAPCLAIAGCGEQNSTASAPGNGGSSVGQIDGGDASTIADLKARFGDKLIRVMLTVKGAGGEAAAAQRQVVAAMKTAGATVADPIAGQPLVVVECKPDQLDAAARTGLVTKIEIDQLDAPN